MFNGFSGGRENQSIAQSSVASSVKYESGKERRPKQTRVNVRVKDEPRTVNVQANQMPESPPRSSKVINRPRKGRRRISGFKTEEMQSLLDRAWSEPNERFYSNQTPVASSSSLSLTVDNVPKESMRPDPNRNMRTIEQEEQLTIELNQSLPSSIEPGRYVKVDPQSLVVSDLLSANERFSFS